MKFTINQTNHLSSSPSIQISIGLLSIFLVFFLPGSAVAANLSNQTDHLALLAFKGRITTDPNGLFNSWNNSFHFCEWQGVVCGQKHQRVVGLNVSFQNLLGTISPQIGNLSFLRRIDLRRNRFHGEIPAQIGNLFRLESILLTNNTLEGRVPSNLSRCEDLLELFLNNNQLVGSIPEELGSLKRLDSLHLGTNQFTGFIPRSFSNLSSMTRFAIFQNNIEGTIPTELGQLTDLTYFSVASNNLTGTIPSSFYNMSRLTKFYVTNNRLTGTFPSNLFLTLPNLTEFGVGINNFQGEIPISLTNASNLEMLDINENMFTGLVPTDLGHLKNLRRLTAEFNLLGSNTTNDLSFIISLSNSTGLQVLGLAYNNFGGEIPSSIWNISVELQQFSLGGNYLTGTIPPVLENYADLYSVHLSENLLSGFIPSSLGKLRNLQVLVMGENRLSGQIPSSLGNMSQLYYLDLSQNNLEGSIPESIGECERLDTLDLSQNSLIGSIPDKIVRIFSVFISLNLSGNSLTGSLPVEVGTLENVNRLDISYNEFTGNIPESIRECVSLEYLYMQGNFFQGTIPTALTTLTGIRELDLSRNNLSGRIPTDIVKLNFLSYLNLSFNNLEGEVPKVGVFENASIVHLLGNGRLCGGIEELELQTCPNNVKKRRISLALMTVMIVLGGFLFLFLVLIIIIVFFRRKSKTGIQTADPMVEKILRVSYHELYQATEGFSEGNLIGSGSFGSVYQGKLKQEKDKLVAVKVFNLENSKASKSFAAECSALRNIRHRNLLKILTYCSSIDSKHNQFMALVYEFMESGNLDIWLHPQSPESTRILGLLERVNVAIDVANAIQYLHDLCEPSIIHCDLKPSNILLDNELIAHVGDFGLARVLFKSIDTFASIQSSSMGIKGSTGYAAPEYGMGRGATKYGDIYSYGVVLLEMMTGKRPTDEIFKADLNIHNHVKTALKEQKVKMIADTTLVATRESEKEAVEGDEHIEHVYEIEVGGSSEECIIEILKIGLACSADAPKERMCMSQVVIELRHIKSKFLGE